LQLVNFFPIPKIYWAHFQTEASIGDWNLLADIKTNKDSETKSMEVLLQAYGEETIQKPISLTNNYYSFEEYRMYNKVNK